MSRKFDTSHVFVGGAGSGFNYGIGKGEYELILRQMLAVVPKLLISLLTECIETFYHWRHNYFS